MYILCIWIAGVPGVSECVLIGKTRTMRGGGMKIQWKIEQKKDRKREREKGDFFVFAIGKVRWRGRGLKKTKENSLVER